ncbi:trans-sulfuration enzyme family protein [Rhodospirillum rubrum]|uniref:Cystathionine gamma-lyase n=1 Tax=Rhodospirillum rubrum (strain ATCC 11170 / ATH 1.1.1 / DSM 467 / LMG 4362 / NCIMB 8255 / S1) TaxID=269796 RepID=Q2RWA5_RHORT|nr:PLP-dependent aspartate aminotransferase family protein [Rhodospirillum rubrum]ABC21590.1 cystathionine gamma-lyase [Rhodospirillum rubrum ATCC 11170]AEO47276.1 cystathionine gamma-lyase [Rhodospirillum rubrum F11]MBK5955798.1 cystathionine gamma-lyase [Rhodospirillum rubrum]QXG81260.1 PLP-dependent aspartate aminotransferase family protein [Rhodospirillum rubrum]HAP99286.1 PLP-dependent transferase [Rhodospirillum rubrum]
MSASIITTTKGFATWAVHAGHGADATTGAVMTPIYATSTFAQSSPGKHTGWEYARSGNPTRAAFERAVAELEGGTNGYAFASGLAAEATILDLLDHGAHIIAGDDLYGGSWRLFEKVRARSAGLTVSYVDPSDLGAVAQAITPQTKLIWIETPSNPLLKIADLAALAALAKEHGLRTVVDSTFATPWIQRPLDLGIDIVVHSATKYLNGHSDVIAGVVVVKDPDLASQLGFLQNATGAVLDPFAAFLALRGLKTLALRMDRHSANGLAVAHALEGRAKVRRVLYPGLASHPQHALARQQMRAFGGMLTLDLESDLAGTVRFLEALKLFTLAESLGGVESLAGHPVTMSHGSIPVERRTALGITDTLVRLSVGIEDAGDLIADLDQALAVV